MRIATLLFLGLSAVTAQAQTCTFTPLAGDSLLPRQWADGKSRPQGGYVAVSRSTEGQGDMIVSRLAADGANIWSKRMATLDQAVSLIPKTIEPTSDGGMIAFGYRSAGYSNMFAVKMDSLGNREWARIYMMNSVPGYDPTWTSSLKQMPNGAYSLVISRNTGISVVRLDQGGVPVWHKTYATVSGFAAAAPTFHVTADGDLILAGIDNSHLMMIRTDSLGAVTWSSRFENTNFIATTFVEDANGDLLIGGRSNGTFWAGGHPGLLKLSGTGSFLWHREYSPWGPATGMLELSNGDLLLSCATSTMDFLRTQPDGTPLGAWQFQPGDDADLLSVSDGTIASAFNAAPFLHPKIFIAPDAASLASCGTATAATLSTQPLPTTVLNTITVQSDSIKSWTMAFVNNAPLSSAGIYSGIGATTPRPGFGQTIFGLVQNQSILGTGPIDVEMTLDPVMVYFNATPPPTNVVGNVITWTDMPSLAPGSYQSIQVDAQIPATTPLGTMIVHSLACSIDSVEVDTTNNTSTFTAPVVGSFDPNDKLVWPEALYDITTDSILTYTIRFQNTGTDTAFTVVVTDTLPENVSVGSFEFLGASHPCTYEITAAGLLTFTFDNILLVDSNMNEPMSHGLLSFRVRPDADITIGETISNSADIYFDFNTPVRTPPAVVTVGIPTGLATVTPEPLRIYPVPVRDMLNIVLPAGVVARRVSITALNGHAVLNAPVNATPGLAQVAVRDLAQGSYVVTVDGSDGLRRSARFVKE
jgi:uncharacterized repeat protein (TIGR01451 family)